MGYKAEIYRYTILSFKPIQLDKNTLRFKLNTLSAAISSHALLWLVHLDDLPKSIKRKLLTSFRQRNDGHWLSGPSCMSVFLSATEP